MKCVKLKRSDLCGFGFSVIGGAGSELPPIVYDIVEGSPAYNSKQLCSGDIIWEVNGREVSNLTTKEVLNCLRLSSSEVTLKLKSDVAIKKQVQQLLASTNGSQALRVAITQDDLAGIRRIKAKQGQLSAKKPSSSGTSSCSDEEGSANSSQASLHSPSANGSLPGLNSEAMEPSEECAPLVSSSDLVLNLTRSDNPVWLTSREHLAPLTKTGSFSVPASPSETDVGTGRLIHKRGSGSPGSLCSPPSIANKFNAGTLHFAYPQTQNSVRISRSEDQLQCVKGSMCTVNIDLEDDITSSLNTLLDTQGDPLSSPYPIEEYSSYFGGIPPFMFSNSIPGAKQSSTRWPIANIPASPDSVHSSHESDSPLINSPRSLQSPQSPPSPSPSSSAQYTCSAMYDKMLSAHDSLCSSNKSEKVCTNSSNGTASPDSDEPGDFDWEDLTPSLASLRTNNHITTNGFGIGHEMKNPPEHPSTDGIGNLCQDKFAIVIRVEGPVTSMANRHDIEWCDSDTNGSPELHPFVSSNTTTNNITNNSANNSTNYLNSSVKPWTFQDIHESAEISCLSEDEAVARKGPHKLLQATSPPLSEDESDIESLHSFHLSPRAVDVPSALRLAKRLYQLDGFKKSDVSRHLSKNNEFCRAVAEEFLNYFDFSGNTLDISLRTFLDRFVLAGETQERERVLVHFSRRYLACNLGTFNSQDAVHTLTCAIMLLNTDLHSENVGHKMTCAEFIDNLAELNDGENFPREVLRSLYMAIKDSPLQWAVDSPDTGDTDSVNNHATVKLDDATGEGIGSNPFLSAPTGAGVKYKKGYVMRKCCVDPNGKKTAFGKRSWKMWFCVIQDLVMYLYKDEQGARRGFQPQLGHNAIRLHHSLATRAGDYSKKEQVFRLQTADQAEYLLQTSDSKELQAWIDTINFVAASLSAPPLPEAVGSQKRFQRPLLPASITKLNLHDQLEDLIERCSRLESELVELRSQPPEKNAKSNWVSLYKEKEAFLTQEVNRYRAYVLLLQSRLHINGSEMDASAPGEGSRSSHGLQRADRSHQPGDSFVDEDIKKQKLCKSMNPFDEDEMVDTETEDKATNTEATSIPSNQQNKKIRKEIKNFNREIEKARKKGQKYQNEIGVLQPSNELEEKTDSEKPDALVSSKKEFQSKNITTVQSNETIEVFQEDPCVGTLGRMTALFRFMKLNHKTATSVSEAKAEQVKSADAALTPPPLPPKPAATSPIMRSIGTRIDI